MPRLDHNRVIAQAYKRARDLGHTQPSFSWILRRHYAGICDKALEKFPSLGLVQAVYTYSFGRPRCLECKNLTPFTSFRLGYMEYCSGSCSKRSEKFQAKFKKTCKERYGVENPYQSKTIRDKARATCRKTYGVDYSFQAKEVRNKIKSTFKKRYGKEHPMQVQSIRKKAIASMNKKVQVVCQGKEFLCQGYEKEVVPFLVRKFGPENVTSQFETRFQKLTLKDGRTYTPDFYLENTETYLEIKSSYTLLGSAGGKDLLERNRHLQTQCDRLGKSLRFVVYDPRDRKCRLLPKGWHKLTKDKLKSLLGDLSLS